MTEKKDIVDAAIDRAKPLLQNLGFGAVMGYCSGMAMKKVGKALAFVVGIGFISLQTAVSFGYIEVDWSKVRVSIVKKVDSTGDGKLNADDAKEYWRRLRRMLTNKIPAAGGFSLGFMWGVKYG